jgi:Zn-dependent M28 family amino/carboxypeptidase
VFQELHASALAALLFVDTRVMSTWPVANGVGAKFMGLVRKPMAYVSLMDAWSLARHGARRVRLRAGGTAVESASCNVVGDLSADRPGGGLIVVCGHLDSVAVGVGADDNASGMAAVLDIARRLRSRRRRHGLRFIGFGAEEQLSLGSMRYVKEQVTDLNRIGFVCNIDGIGAHLGLSTAMCTGTAALEAYVREALETRLPFGQVTADVSPYQDQFWFAAQGIPGIWMARETHPGTHWYHHSAHNDLGVVSMRQIAWAAEVASDLLGDLADTATWPFPREIEPSLRERIGEYRRELFE